MTNSMNYITNWEETKAHILSKYPEEAGGIIKQDGTFVPCENVAEDKLHFYEIAQVEWMSLCDDTRAILHSHTYDQNVPPELDPRIPSEVDMQGQVDTDVEWCIVVTEGENVTQPYWWGDDDHRPPLMDRQFIHTLQDCSAFMKDWLYLEYGLKLPVCPRRPDWYLTGHDFITERYESWGFVDVTNLPEERGDVVFMQIVSNVVNHVGIVVEPGMMVHHLFNRYPDTEPLRKWNKYITRRIRHKTHPAFKGE